MSVTVPELHIGPVFVGPAVGAGVTVTCVVYIVAGLQPGILTVNEYVLVTVGVAVGFCAVVDDKFDPLHKYPVTPPEGVAVSVTVATLQIGPLLDTTAVGLLTVTVVVYTVVGLQPETPPLLLTVSE